MVVGVLTVRAAAVVGMMSGAGVVGVLMVKAGAVVGTIGTGVVVSGGATTAEGPLEAPAGTIAGKAAGTTGVWTAMRRSGCPSTMT
ncbi:hypothetical protein G4Z16_27565 [Streptomyces bathyalis]|uniref:Uncharacterized protein n=1 Tax=Streptomyces bathyalis TaxID=2710756 RepID=A0A7T1T274_9ACTN|nr:hypothetical protein [Streptomyces bathyalis]QPP05030.1 hypothetical protein G4Z16_27565 [Streptomyces bathyalis]